MDHEFELKLQAHLDGELSEADSRTVAVRVAQDQQALALLAELRNTRQALASSEPGLKMPESREFFWSKIEREICRQPRPEPVRPSMLAGWRKFFLPAATAAALGLAALVGSLHPGLGSGDAELQVAATEPGAFTYRDYSAGATLVWLPYPAENDVAGGRK